MKGLKVIENVLSCCIANPGFFTVTNGVYLIDGRDCMM
jgi:hypothetical protein